MEVHYLNLPFKSVTMGTFVITKMNNDLYKITFASRKGKIVFTTVSCKHKVDSVKMIEAIKSEITSLSITKVKSTGGKYFFRLSKDGLVLAASRKFTTELLLSVPSAEVLDFSENDFAFAHEDTFAQS
jgi:hypothetical protein